MKPLSIIAFVICFAVKLSHAQGTPFYNEIQQFKKQDSISQPPKNAILFVGSSSFRMWQTLQKDFPGYVIINRGFGGSNLLEVNMYAKDIIFPYQPKQILIYGGDNDLSQHDSVNANVVLRRFVELFNNLRSRLPNAHISFVAIKPSPSRKHLMPQANQANLLIRGFLQDKLNTSFIDIYHPMLDESGEARKDIFLNDNLHMNEKGYEIWKRIIQPYLIK